MRALAYQALRFGSVGVVNTLIGLSCIYSLMFFVRAGAGPANAAGYVVGLGISFALNHVWTFSSTRPVRDVLPRYIAAAMGCYGFNLGMVLFGTHILRVNPYLAQLIGVCAYTGGMFLTCRWFVFPQTPIAQTSKYVLF